MRKPAGRYNRSISIYRSAPTADTAGGLDTDAGTLLCNRLAAMSPGLGREPQVKNQQHATNDTTFFLPYDPVAILAEPTGKIVYAGRTFSIVYVDDVEEAHEEIAIGTTERIT